MVAETTQNTSEDSVLGRGGTWRLTAAGLSMIAVCYGLARFAYGLFVPVFRDEFALSAATAGAIASGSYASYCVAIVIATLLTPRLGGRVVAVAAGCIATAGTLVIALAPTMPVLALGVVVAGASTGVASPPLAHLVAHAVAGSRRDRVQAVINAGTGLGVAVAGPVALLTHQQWRMAWLAFAVLCAIVTLWNLVVLPRRGRSTRGIGRVGFLPRPLVPAGSVRLILAALLMGAASAAVWTFGRDLVVSEGQMSENTSTIGWILLGTFGVLGSTAGDMTRRLGLKAAWTLTMATLAASTVLLAAFPASISAAWLALAAFGASYIALTGFLLIWGTRVYTQNPAAGVGLAFLLIALGQAIAAPAIGSLAELIGARWAFVAAALVSLVGIFCQPPASTSEITD